MAFEPASGRSAATSRSGTGSVHGLSPGAIALRLGIPLDWDPKAEKFVGPRADKGNAMISREMRSPWRIEV